MEFISFIHGISLNFSTISKTNFSEVFGMTMISVKVKVNYVNILYPKVIKTICHEKNVITFYTYKT